MIKLQHRIVACIMALAASTATAEAPKAPLPKDESNAIEREIATRIINRTNQTGDKRAKTELEIDLRIILRGIMSIAAQTKPDSNDHPAIFLRARQMRECVRGLEETIAQESSAPSPSQKDAMAQLHKLSFAIPENKNTKELDDYTRAVAFAMANVVNATPVDSKSVLPMRPKAQVSTPTPNQDRPPTMGELAEQIQKLAAISVTLRQQLLALSQQAGADDNENPALYAILNQSVTIARGLQNSTAVNADTRGVIESQLAEGVALFSDPRTRDAGKARIDSLNQYRQFLSRVGKMNLSRDQMDQLSPALSWAQANPEGGPKVLASIDQYIEVCAKYDAMPKDVAIPANLKRFTEEVVAQFTKQRALFIQDAAKGAAGVSALEADADELHHLFTLVNDLYAMGPSIDTINAYKLKPVGGLEKKIVAAALAVSNKERSVNRIDAEKYLHAVHELATFSQTLGAKSFTDIPPAVARDWSGGKLDAFEARWKSVVADLAATLIAGSIELDHGKVIRLETAVALGEQLHRAAQLESTLPRLAPLARWADWNLDPATLSSVIAPYKESTIAAFSGFISDNLDAIDRWNKLTTRYIPLIALLSNETTYAEECQKLPIGLAGDIARLATPFDNQPFTTERFAATAITAWSTAIRANDPESADKIASNLAKRITRDLRLETPRTTRPK